jgi:3-deoxy-D-manno-octulosonic-acid transferase
MAMLLYRLFYLPALILALPYYLYRMWRRGGYRKGFSNRFGSMKGVPEKRPGVRRIWIQAVSVGELMAVTPLIRELNKDPGIEIVLTTTTSTGYRLLEDRFAENTVWRGVFPMDFWPFSRRAWRSLRPDLAVLMEGELWPEHIQQAYLRKVPSLLINARLSDRSFSRHLRIRTLATPFFRKLSGILAGSQSDLERFQQLAWIGNDRIRFTGNLKLDLDTVEPLTQTERLAGLSAFGNWPAEGQILLGSSTWPGEESALLDCFSTLRQDFPDLRLLIVPRHAERRREIEALLKASGLNFHFRSESPTAPDGTLVYVADTTGELQHLTRFADIVLIGKSLPPNTGGQTPIEAASLGKPLLFGPDMSNFRDVSRRLIREQGARRIADGTALTSAVRELLDSPDIREEMGRRAGGFIATSRGATDRTAAVLREFISS